MVTTLTPFGEYLQSHIDEARRWLRRTFVINPRNWWEHKTNEWITALFVRAIKLRPVQEEIAYQMGGNTPLCRVMKDAISSYYDAQDTDIDVDDITGFEQAVENMLEKIDIEASSVIGLEDYIIETIENAEFKAESVQGLGDLIDEKVTEEVQSVMEQMTAANDQEIDADKINDLDVEVRASVHAALQEDEVMDEITKAVGRHLADKLTS